MKTLTSNEQQNLEMAEKMIAQPLWRKVLPGVIVAVVIFPFNLLIGEAIWKALITSLFLGLFLAIVSDRLYAWTYKRLIKKRDGTEQL